MMDVLWEVEVGWSPMIPYLFSAASARASGVLFLWFPRINTHNWREVGIQLGQA